MIADIDGFFSGDCDGRFDITWKPTSFSKLFRYLSLMVWIVALISIGSFIGTLVFMLICSVNNSWLENYMEVKKLIPRPRTTFRTCLTSAGTNLRILIEERGSLFFAGAS